MQNEKVPYENIKNHAENKVLNSPSIQFKGFLNGIEVSILKEDSCTTNIISHDFVEKHRNNLRIIKV